MRILITIFLFASSLSYAEQHFLTPQDVLIGFPFCTISSSYSQKCKNMTDEEQADFTPSMIDEITGIEKAANTLHVTTDDWVYSFSISNSGSNKAILRFTDDAKLNTYLSSTKFDVQWSKEKKNWFMLGEITDYSSGISEDKGKYISYPDPIPFHLKN
ncbi:MAG: hypothetical protein CMK44_06480 [Porticoccus sp.]|jgi:hypothetical protein|nr:hypothetical protein [Porticoccus sp.]|tara:strand:+ start:724 stop:1197 length:474 start_codon:yes stop_codon:yes gene_type:complete